MEEHCEKEVDAMEKEAKYTIIQMEEETDSKHLLDDTKKEINRLYGEFREWMSENVDSEEVAARLKKLKQDSNALIEKGKEKTIAFYQREDVTKVKEKALIAGEKVMDTVNEGIQSVMQKEAVVHAMDSFSDKVQQVTCDERVKTNVKKLKKGTLKFAEKAFDGLKKVLDTDDSDDGQKG